MAYAQVQPNETLFAADESKNTDVEALAFQDFSTTNTGRLSPGPSGLYGPDEAIGRQINNGASSMLSLEYYTRYFDVDTKLVLERAWRTMYPREDYIDVILNGMPDLYGPFWGSSTLVLVLFLSSSLASSISAYLSGQPYSYDFGRLSLAVSVIYSYAFGVPVALWAVMRYWAGAEGRSAVDMISLYGYGLVVWIPVALLCIPPVEIARFAFCTVGFILSGYFLLRNIYPTLSSAESKAARGLVLAIAILHAALTFVLWFGFLGVASGIKVVPPVASDPGTGSGDGTSGDI